MSQDWREFWDFFIFSSQDVQRSVHTNFSRKKKKNLNEPIEGNIRGPADSQVMALIIPQLSFGTISEPQWDVMIENSNNDQSASQCVPWDTQGELMDEMSGLGNT